MVTRQNCYLLLTVLAYAYDLDGALRKSTMCTVGIVATIVDCPIVNKFTATKHPYSETHRPN